LSFGLQNKAKNWVLAKIKVTRCNEETKKGDLKISPAVVGANFDNGRV